MCGATKQIRHDVPALPWQGEREEMSRDYIETKVRSEKNRAKYVAVTWGDETYL